MPKDVVLALAGVISSPACLPYLFFSAAHRVAAYSPLISQPSIVSQASTFRPVTYGVIELDPELEAQERSILNDLNRERAARGLNTLALDPILSEAAREHSQEMCRLSYFDHFSPTPGAETPTERYLRVERSFGAYPRANFILGENLYKSSHEPDDVGLCTRALMHSPPHRANILDPAFDQVGIGAWRDDNGNLWVTEMFLGQRAPQVIVDEY